MKLRRTHIPEKLLNSRERRISEEVLLHQVLEILLKDDKKDEAVIQRLSGIGNDDNENIRNNFKANLLEGQRIFHLSDIEKTCIHYRLRFLDAHFYKAEFPYDTVIRIKELEKQHEIALKGFKLMAPASVFKLKNADDPLLFAPIANDYYYLIHSWGKDLHPLRKILMWPFRNLENFMIFLLIMSMCFTSLIPSGMFSPDHSTTEFVVLFFFMFKWITGLSIFYGFKYGKNFSSAIWRSTFSNA